MATESKVKTYLVPLWKVFQSLQSATGQAPIGPIHEVVITAVVTPVSWKFKLVGLLGQTFYETQTYIANAAEVAVFLNNHAGTSFTGANIIAIGRAEDNSFIEVTTQ